MKKILGLLVLAGAVAAAVVWQPWADDEVAVDVGVDRAIAESVSVRTLTDEITIRGELRRDELQVVTAAAPGKVGAVTVSDGETVEAGDLLLSVDGRQVVAVAGDFLFGYMNGQVVKQELSLSFDVTPTYRVAVCLYVAQLLKQTQMQQRR